jgi:hypothetical protein
MKGFLESIDSGAQRSKDRNHLAGPAGRFAPVGATLMVILVAAAGCGGTANPRATPMDMAGGQKHGMGQKCEAGPECEMGKQGEMGKHGEMGEKANMPPSIAKFHETLAPRWHTPQGPQRMTDTCAAISQLHTDAAAIVAAPAPDGANAVSWSAGGQQLAEAVTALETICKAKDAAAFEPAFARVHTSFHHAMEAAGGHGGHGAHGHGAHKM